MSENPVTAAQVADKTVDRVFDIVTATVEKSSSIFEAAANIITDAVMKYGPQAVDVVLWVVRIDAAQYLLIGWLMFFVSAASAVFVWTGFSRRGWRQRWSNESDEHNIVQFCMVAPLVIMALVMGSKSIDRVTDGWQYVAVAKPELYLAKQAVDAVKAKLAPPASTCK